MPARPRRVELKLLVLRHAKSEPNRPGARDLDRTLNSRGRRDAQAVGRALLERDLVPALALCSPALRTRQTLSEAAAAWSGKCEQRPVEEMYEAQPAELVGVVRRYGGARSPLLLVGHNPGLQRFALALAADAAAGAAEAVAADFPTAALAVLDVQAEQWDDLAAHSARLEACVLPSELV